MMSNDVNKTLKRDKVAGRVVAFRGLIAVSDTVNCEISVSLNT
jgi:hypothetical protein